MYRNIETDKVIYRYYRDIFVTTTKKQVSEYYDLCHSLWKIVNDQVCLPVPLVHVGLGGDVHPGSSQHVSHSILHHLKQTGYKI